MRSPLYTPEAWEISDRFHQFYYGLVPRWCGLPILKNPMDLLIYQEIFWETRPETLIECGTAWGGSAFYFACLMDLLGEGQVLTIDLMTDVPRLYRWALGESYPPPLRHRPKHPRIQYLTGNTVDPNMLKTVMDRTIGRTMVVLDADHRAPHVLQECECYAPLVSDGCYLCIEDVNINNRPIPSTIPGPGPYEAAMEFLEQHDQFHWDTYWSDQYLMTYNAYLKKLAPGVQYESREVLRGCW